MSASASLRTWPWRAGLAIGALQRRAATYVARSLPQFACWAGAWSHGLGCRGIQPSEKLDQWAQRTVQTHRGN
jgi:hypothetical protein